MPKPLNVQVASMDAELEFQIQAGTKGKNLFDQYGSQSVRKVCVAGFGRKIQVISKKDLNLLSKVVKTLNLREVWYFGLQFTDGKGYNTWLKNNKKIHSQISKVDVDVPLKFRFRIKYYPEDVAEELIQDATQRMFFLQVKEQILNDEIYCSPETSVLLASYAVIAKYGEYQPDLHKPGFLNNELLLPQRVLDQHSITKQQWEERIVAWYSEHKGMLREDAVMEYLKIAQDLEMYGVNYFDIRNKNGTELWLGVDALGVNVYEKEDKLTPRIGFPWSEIRNISFSNKKFVIQPIDKKSPDFIFFASRTKINKRILALCMGNHELYLRRRQPESVEVEQMRAQARNERSLKQADRVLFLKERKQREDAESQRKELEDRLTRYESDFQDAKSELEMSKKTAQDLEERMTRAERDHRELEEVQRIAEEARRRAEQSAHLEKEEREKKEREAFRAQAELERRIRESREREKETRRLQEELDYARREIEEKQRTLQEILTVPHRVQLFEKNKDFKEQNLDLMPNESKVIVNDTKVVPRPDLDSRTVQTQKSQLVIEQLQSLSADLAAAKLRTQMTRNDILHQQNLAEGRDKYKTLKQIRQGNTKQRVDMFEAM